MGAARRRFLGIEPRLRGLPAQAATAAILTALTLVFPWLLLPLPALLALVLFLRSLGLLRFLSLTDSNVHRLAWGAFTPEALGRFLGWMMVIAFAVNLAVAAGFHAAGLQSVVFSQAGPLLVELQSLLHPLADTGRQGYFSILVAVSLTLSVYWVCFLLLACIGNGPTFYYTMSTRAFKGGIGMVVVGLIAFAVNVMMHSDYAITQSHRDIFHRLMSYEEDPVAAVITAFGFTFLSAFAVPLFLYLLCFVVPRVICEHRTGHSPEAGTGG